MNGKEKRFSARGNCMLLLVLINVLVLKTAFVFSNYYYLLLLITAPLLLFVAGHLAREQHRYSDQL